MGNRLREEPAVYVARWRAAGKSSDQIARDAHAMIRHYSLTEDDLRLTLPERAALRKFAVEIEARRRRSAPITPAQEAASAERRRQYEEGKAAASARRKGMRKGRAVMAAKVRAALSCTLPELNRWASDGRLAPDGELVFSYIRGRAWLPTTVENAKVCIAAWREQDKIAKIARRKKPKIVR